LKNTTDNKKVENRKRIIKNVKDIEKITQIMTKNGIAELEADGVRVVMFSGFSIKPVKMDKTMKQFEDLTDDDIAEWSSN